MTSKSFPPKATEFVGAHLPRPLASFLRLLAVYKGTSIQKTIEEMVSKRREETNENGLVEAIAVQTVEAWWDAGRTPDLEEYLKAIEEELEKRKVSDYHKKAIMDLIKEQAPWYEGDPV